MTTFTLETKDVVKKYPGKQGEKTVLNRINLSLRRGEFCSVVGPSGCGKSTLLRLVLGDEVATSGTLLVDGAPVGAPDRTRGIVYQNYAIFPHLTVLKNVVLGLELGLSSPLGRRLRPWRHWTRSKEWKEQAFEILRRVGMEKHADKYPHNLSGGQRQRIALAQTLITKPAIVLMDEPFSGLDPGTRNDMQLWIKELHENDPNMTVMFVTHDINEAIFLSTRLIALSQHWHDHEKQPGEGAKIVADVKPPEDKTDSVALQKCQEAILAVGFDKERYSSESEFIIDHPDATLEQPVEVL